MKHMSVLLAIGILAWIAGGDAKAATVSGYLEVTGNTTIQGSMGVGQNTDIYDSYGDDTIRLKEDVLRIHFDDTSTTPGAPSNDWRIVVNDSDGGTNSYFGIMDAGFNDSVQNMVFRIDAGAPADSLHIDRNGVVSFANTPLSLPWLSSSSNAPASASGPGSTAIGSGAVAGAFDTAVGAGSIIRADGSTAVGANTVIDSANSVAVGADALVESGADGGTAIGQNARVRTGAANSVALGRGAVATEPNTVSVGAPGNERRITNVAPGVNNSDAATVGQVNAVSREVASHGRRIAQNAADIERNRQDVETLRSDLDEQQRESRAGIAATAALAAPITPSAPGRTTLNMNVANFKDANAVGISAVHRLVAVSNVMINAGISLGNDAVVTRVGFGWEF